MIKNYGEMNIINITPLRHVFQLTRISKDVVQPAWSDNIIDANLNKVEKTERNLIIH